MYVTTLFYYTVHECCCVHSTIYFLVLINLFRLGYPNLSDHTTNVICQALRMACFNNY